MEQRFELTFEEIFSEMKLLNFIPSYVDAAHDIAIDRNFR